MTDQQQLDTLAALLPQIQSLIASQNQPPQSTRAQQVAQIQFQLGGATDVQLLTLAEAAGNPVDAVNSIATNLGCPMIEFPFELRTVFSSLILTRLQAARPLARAGSYRWYY
jgi:hypothetical protein